MRVVFKVIIFLILLPLLPLILLVWGLELGIRFLAGEFD